MAQRTFEHTADYKGQRQSIGIVNIHERFVLYFGDRYNISVESTERWVFNIESPFRTKRKDKHV